MPLDKRKLMVTLDRLFSLNTETNTYTHNENKCAKTNNTRKA